MKKHPVTSIWFRAGIGSVLLAAVVLCLRAVIDDDWDAAAGPGLTALAMSLLLVHSWRVSRSNSH